MDFRAQQFPVSDFDSPESLGLELLRLERVHTALSEFLDDWIKYADALQAVVHRRWNERPGGILARPITPSELHLARKIRGPLRERLARLQSVLPGIRDRVEIQAAEEILDFNLRDHPYDAIVKSFGESHPATRTEEQRRVDAFHRSLESVAPFVRAEQFSVADQISITKYKLDQRANPDRPRAGNDTPPFPSQQMASKPPLVFLGHGRSKLWAEVQLHLQNDLRIQAEAFESGSHAGRHIVEVLSDLLDRATFAILILTAEDVTQEGARRARQNVIHEAGLFQGRLGFNRAILLVEEGIEEFTNIAGLQQIRFEAPNVQHSFYQLDRVLRREGVIG